MSVEHRSNIPLAHPPPHPSLLSIQRPVYVIEPACAGPKISIASFIHTTLKTDCYKFVESCPCLPMGPVLLNHAAKSGSNVRNNIPKWILKQHNPGLHVR